MLSSGNGPREICAANLIKTIRGEVPYERTKGINRRMIDTPSINESAIKADVSWLIETYEPRISNFDVRLAGDDAEQGAFGVNLTVK